ncbi:MAG: bifunctional adenosylcobinamide kinase/adenosylcobinamide-phosphate guanylyltransferase [Myxococcota bacterium]
MSRLLLVGGGSRSGKSEYALQRARAISPKRAFVATAQAFDDEMRSRIARHRAERKGQFDSFESPTELVALLSTLEHEVVVVDCLTLWMSNLLLEDRSDAEILHRVDRLVDCCVRREGTTLLVTNEVGLGIVPEHALARRFRDLAGFAHQRLAAAADEVVLLVFGIPLKIKQEASDKTGSSLREHP